MRERKIVRVEINRDAAVTVRVPARVRRDAGPNGQWSAEAACGKPGVTGLRVFGADTEAAAKHGLAVLVADVLSTVDTTPILVVGGAAPEYHKLVHIITPSVFGHNVHVAREGRAGYFWDHGERDTEAMLKVVLDHVGGNPLVVRF
jgi:hypothetical protein